MVAAERACADAIAFAPLTMWRLTCGLTRLFVDSGAVRVSLPAAEHGTVD